MAELIVNANLARRDPDPSLQAYAVEAMPSPGIVDPKAIKKNGHVYIPFFERGVLRKSREIFDEWGAEIQSGVTIFEDRFDPDNELLPSLRFYECFIASFQSSEDFHSGGFFGRFIILRREVFMRSKTLKHRFIFRFLQ